MLFPSSRDGDASTSLAEYVGRMPDGQTSLYYVTGESRAVVERSPHLEAFRARGYEVLYCQRDATVGTRFKTEKCYNEEQLRTYMMVTEAQRRDLDRIRTNCGGGPCTPYEPPTPNR